MVICRTAIERSPPHVICAGRVFEVTKVAHNVTIRDIAEHLGLTHATVSRALNDHAQTSAVTKARVRDAAAALGYVPHLHAQMMRRGTSSFFGLVVPDIENPFYGTVAKAMVRPSSDAGMQLLLCISDDDPAAELRQVRALQAARVAGIAITLTAKPLPATMALLKDLPGVQLVRRKRGGPACSVALDDAAGVEEAVAHLLALDHRRIAYVGAPLELSTGAARFKGFSDAHRRKRLIVKTSLVRLGPPRPAFGRESVLELMAAHARPTAILLGSPQLTLGALEGLTRAGVAIPGAVSLISYGDAEWFAAIEPAVTAVQLPTQEMARATIDALLSLRADADRKAPPHVMRHAVFAPKLIVRGTTAPPR